MARHFVYLGGVGQTDAAESTAGQDLLHEDSPLNVGDRLELVRTRSPWNPHRDVERVLIGSHAVRSDVLLRGDGIRPEHIRLYLPRTADGPDDLRAIPGARVLVNGREVDHHEWCDLQSGDEVVLAHWRFRFERSTRPTS